ncbi:putative F-box/FBD/LRR-repeat protein At1g78760 isoform X2 [Trifolium pratense]|uniref:putative F-box/FBD/LRR-repeat protein At1g78760 isoform X2 n=1 Tax=Trifolium pratense TaxID=57577 RepID=UPI001E6909E0|nr:putative F-box/FBD/LRR-repeat protein At1g78760 isoform X2 [Trifolium pratense]
MSKSIDEVTMIPSEKRARHDNEENQDRLSDLPDCVLLHILSFFNSKHAVRTCVLSTRWKYIWKRIHTLILHSTDFSTVKKFSIFVSKILTLRDISTALYALDLQFHHYGDIEPQLLKNIFNHISSHNTHLQELRISIDTCLSWDSSCRARALALASLCDTRRLIMSCVSLCRALTSLKLSLYPPPHYLIGGDNYTETFPKSLNLPLLTSLDLTNFTFCGGENGCVEPFSAFTKLNSLVIGSCKVKDAQILRISSETLVNLSMYYYSSNVAKVELSTPSLCTFTFPTRTDQKICGSGLSSVKQVNINAEECAPTVAVSMERALVLLSMLQDLANVESLTVTSLALQVLSLVPDLFKVKFSSLCNLKSLKVELIPYVYGGGLRHLREKEMLKKVAAKSRQEATKLRKAFKEGLRPPPIPDGIIDFLRQNSPSSEVNIVTNYPSHFNLKRVEESIKGGKNTGYHSQFATPAASSAVPASAAESGSAAAASATARASTAPPTFHLCHTEKIE